MRYENIWQFKTPNFTVDFDITPDEDLDLSWDEGGEARKGIESGLYTAFVARVRVSFKGAEVGVDYLGGCIYRSAEEFMTSHRDPDPLNRNSSIMRAARGGNVSICHYFPGMVREAVSEARKHLRDVPRLRR